MEKFFKSVAGKRTTIALVAAILIIAAVIVLPKITGKSLGELFESLIGDVPAAEESGVPAETASQPQTQSEAPVSGKIAEDGEYTSKEDVALYIFTYNKLPKNFITKSQAESLGWEGGPLWDYAPGKSIGGDVFGNREGLLPKKSGRTWYECDINYAGESRGAERIVFSNDGLVYYTGDHYESFTEIKRGDLE